MCYNYAKFSNIHMVKPGGQVYRIGSIGLNRVVVKTTIVIGGITTVIVVTAKVVTSNWFKDWCFKTRIGNWFYNKVLQYCSSEIAPDMRRSILNNVPQDTTRNNSNHSHPAACKGRAYANAIMESAAIKSGFIPYNYQMSPTQQRMKTMGCRTIYCAKDLQMQYQRDGVTDKHMIILTDVDYYLNMNDLLDGHMLLMYTFVPLATAGKVENGVYNTKINNEVETIITGGARYQHPLWDYDSDHIVVDKWYGSVIYLIESIKITPTRRVIIFNPVRKIYGPLAWILPGRRLLRRQLVFDGVAYSRYTEEKDGECSLYHSFSMPDSCDSVVIKSDAFEATGIRLGSNKDAHLSDAERYFNTFKVANPVYGSSVMYHIYKNNPGVFNFKPPVITQPTTVDKHTYQSTIGLTSEDGKPTMRAIWPGYSVAYAPAKSFNNDLACIEGRINEPKNQRFKIPRKFDMYMKEFVEFVVPDALIGSVAPLSFEEMWEQFDRPTQRRLLQVADFTPDPKVSVKAFQKREAYAKITSPRNISTLPMGHNFTIGQFSIPLKDHIFKKAHWYGFGIHPRELTDRLLKKISVAEYATEVDFDKLDGSAYEWFRDLFVTIMRRAFPSQYHDEITKRELEERNCKGTTAFGVRYNIDGTVVSGSSITSLLGCVINAFLHYAAYRIKYSAIIAYAMLGIYCGDDGVSADMPPEHIMKTIATFGMSCKANKIDKHHPITFLGRIYPDLWTHPGSIADVARQMRKLHLTCSPKTVPDWLVLYRKAIGYKITDPDTPVLTAWCDKVINLLSNEKPEDHKYYGLTLQDSIYWSKYDKPFVSFPNQENKLEIISESMGLTIFETLNFEMRIRNAKVLTDLFMDSIFKNENKPTIDSVYNGQVLPKSPTTHLQVKVADNRQLKTGLCRFIKRNKPCPYPQCKFTHTK